MENVAPAAHPIAPLFSRRWSARAFSGGQVSDGQLKSLLEAARWAPSAFNGQPWRFMVASSQNAAEFKKMLNCLAEANQVWAQKAGLLMIAVTARHGAGGQPNRWHMFDLGLAVENMLLQAHELGLYGHCLAGFSVDKARQTCAIPEDFEPLTALAIGCPGNPDDLPDFLRQREGAPRQRTAVNEFAFAGKWGAQFL